MCLFVQFGIHWRHLAWPDVKIQNVTFIFLERIERERPNDSDLNDVACGAKFDAQQRTNICLSFEQTRSNKFRKDSDTFLKYIY